MRVLDIAQFEWQILLNIMAYFVFYLVMSAMAV